MLRHCFTFAFLHLALAAAAAPCNVRERAILGNWQAVGNAAFFEQMSFELEGSQREFNSWRHDRPEFSQAEWRLEDCRLTVRESPTVAQTFTVSLRGTRLVIASVDGRMAGTYRKTGSGR